MYSIMNTVLHRVTPIQNLFLVLKHFFFQCRTKRPFIVKVRINKKNVAVKKKYSETRTTETEEGFLLNFNIVQFLRIKIHVCVFTYLPP